MSANSLVHSLAVRRFIPAFVLANLILPFLLDAEVGLKVSIFQMLLLSTPVASAVAVIYALVPFGYSYWQMVIWAIGFIFLPTIPMALLNDARFFDIVAPTAYVFALLVGAVIVWQHARIAHLSKLISPNK